MKSYKYIILGGGVAGGYAAKEFGRLGVKPGELAIISAEPVPPYQRPHLTKEYFSRDESFEEILINDSDFYDKSHIDLMLDTTVIAADLQKRVLTLKSGGELGFEKLLIATGSVVRRLQIPGADLEGIFYIRNVANIDAIRAYAEGKKNAVVIGGSFIGMESTAELTMAGLKVHMVYPDARVWQRVFTPEISEFFRRVYESEGVTLVPNDHAASIQGQGKVSGVTLGSGRQLPADLVVAGIGVVPALDLFANSGLRMDNGLVVDETLQTNIPGVYAAGDVARYRDPVSGDMVRIEHWDVARRQGRAAAANMVGPAKPYDAVRYFYSDIFGMGWELWGDADLSAQVVYRGDLEQGPFTAWWFRDGGLIAAFTIDPPQEDMDKLAPKWIRAHQKLSAKDLADSSKPLRELAK